MILSGEGRYVPGSQSSTTSVDSDPFTGQGRYIPGGGVTNGAAGGTDPFTGGGRYVPTYREEPKRKPVGAGDSRAADPITGDYTLMVLLGGLTPSLGVVFMCLCIGKNLRGSL